MSTKFKQIILIATGFFLIVRFLLISGLITYVTDFKDLFSLMSICGAAGMLTSVFGYIILNNKALQLSEKVKSIGLSEFILIGLFGGVLTGTTHMAYKSNNYDNNLFTFLFPASYIIMLAIGIFIIYHAIFDLE